MSADDDAAVTIEELRTMPLEKLTGALARLRGGTTFLAIELRRVGPKDIEAHSHASLDAIASTPIETLTALDAMLTAALDYHRNMLFRAYVSKAENPKKGDA